VDADQRRQDLFAQLHELRLPLIIVLHPEAEEVDRHEDGVHRLARVIVEAPAHAEPFLLLGTQDGPEKPGELLPALLQGGGPFADAPLELEIVAMDLVQDSARRTLILVEAPARALISSLPAA